MLIINHILWSIPVVVIAFVYSYVLTQPDMILNRWYRFLAQKAPAWLFYPLVHCEKCVSGQLALWIYPLLIISLMDVSYNLFMHIWYITQCILEVIILKSIYENWIVPINVPEFKHPPTNAITPLTPKPNVKS